MRYSCTTLHHASHRPTPRSGSRQTSPQSSQRLSHPRASCLLGPIVHVLPCSIPSDVEPDRGQGDKRDEKRTASHRSALVACPCHGSPVGSHRPFANPLVPSASTRWGESSTRPMGALTCPSDNRRTSCHSQGAMHIHAHIPTRGSRSMFP